MNKTTSTSYILENKNYEDWRKPGWRSVETYPTYESAKTTLDKLNSDQHYYSRFRLVKRTITVEDELLEGVEPTPKNR
jgi:hypothetical protein